MIIGSIVALVTPLTAGINQIDRQCLEQLVEWHVAAGTSAIVAVGTTGESATLNVDEHLEVIQLVVEQARGRIKVIAGTGANSTSEAIELTSRASEVGVDACLLVTPYYNKPTQRGLYLHHLAIAEAVDIPQILYNVPGRTACDMLPETVLSLAEVPNIIGVKEATGDMERARLLIESHPENFAVYSGDDGTATELMLLGGDGNISVTANVAPQQMSEICAAAIAGKTELARSLNLKLAEVHHAMFVESNPIPVKWALAEMEKIPSGIRLPLTELSEEYRLAVRQALEAAGLL